MISAHRNSPNIKITLLIDDKTNQSLTGIRRKFADEADEIIVIPIEDGFSAMERSRILKTSTRLHVSGDFLFIDTDTIVVRPLDELDTLAGPIMACNDSHSVFKDNPYKPLALKDGKALEWPIENETSYFNSGVIFVKDCEETHSFFKLWHETWLKGRENGVKMDQPSFAKTNYLLGHPIKPLDDVWNVEILHGTKYLGGAKILHYLCTNNDGASRLFLLRDKSVLMTVKESGEITPEISAALDDIFSGIDSFSTILTQQQTKWFTSDLYRLADKLNASGLSVFSNQMAKWLLALSRLKTTLRGSKKDK